MLKDDFGSALHQQHLPAAGVAVQSRHELVLGFERDRIRPRGLCLLGLPVQPHLGGEGVERSFGGIALHAPHPILLQQFRVVAKHGNPPHQIQNRVVARGLAGLQNLADRCVALTGDAVRRFGGDCRDHHHFHQGQRARLIGADTGYRAESFDRGQEPDDGVAFGHPLNADRQRHRDERRQSFRNHRHRDADHRLKDFHEGQVTHPPAEQKHDHAHDSDRAGDAVSELLDLPQQRRLQRANRGHHLVDTAQFRMRARRHYNAGGPPCCHQGAGECHPFAIANRGFFGYGVGGFVDRNRLARKCRLFGPQVLHVDQSKVRRNLVPGFEKHDVAWNQPLRWHHANLFAAQGSSFRGQHVANRVQRLFRFTFLYEAEQRIEQDYAENNCGIEPEPHHQLDEPRGDQNIDQDIVQLHEKPHERPSLAPFRQLISPVSFEAAGHLVRVEPGLRVAVELPDYLIGGNRMPYCALADIWFDFCGRHTLDVLYQMDVAGFAAIQEMVTSVHRK